MRFQPMAKKRVRGLDGFGSEVDAFPLPGCCVITLGWGFFSIEWEQPLLVVNYVNTHGGWEWGKHTHTHTHEIQKHPKWSIHIRVWRTDMLAIIKWKTLHNL